MMNTFNLGEWPIFHPSHQRLDKWQALKVLEEASEVVEAAKECVNYDDNLFDEDEYETLQYQLTDEIADLLQTIVNLCDAYNLGEDDLKVARARCVKINDLRGMFSEGPRTHMHREEDNND